MMKKHSGMRPQDILVLLKVLVWSGKNWRIVDLAQKIGLSQSEVSESLSRSLQAGLVAYDKRTIHKNALYEFLIYGLKYVFPVNPGALSRGMPTAHSALPLSKVIVSSNGEQYVWPYALGDVRGQSIEPLYGSIPLAATKDVQLYELLSLIDAIRIGRTREQKIAIKELKKRILGKNA